MRLTHRLPRKGLAAYKDWQRPPPATSPILKQAKLDDGGTCSSPKTACLVAYCLPMTVLNRREHSLTPASQELVNECHRVCLSAKAFQGFSS